MESKESYFEAGVSRHAPKIDKPSTTGDYDVAHQSIDIEKTREAIEKAVEVLLVDIEKGPEGLITALEPSNISRTQETRDLYAQELKNRAGNSIRVVEIPEDPEQAEQLLKEIQNHPDQKYIISNLRETWLIGFQEDDAFTPAVNKWKKDFNGDENLVGKLWAAHPDELPELEKQIKQRGLKVNQELNPASFVITPEERALRQVRWMKAMKEIGEKHFPERPLRLEGISHNMVSDFAILKLLGEDISVQSIDTLLDGEFRKPLERSSIKFVGDTVIVQYRDMKKEYSKEEFDHLIKKIRKDSEERKKEWGKEEPPLEI